MLLQSSRWSGLRLWLCLLAEVLREDFVELCEPGGVCGPGGAGDEVAVGDGLGHLERDEGAAGEFDLGGACGVGVEALAGDDTGGSEDLRTVAERCDGFVGLGEVADDVEDFGVEAEVLGSAAAWDDETVVVLRLDVGEGGVEDEVVASLFGVGLVAFEVVDGSADELTGLLVGTDCVDSVSDHLEGLEGNHDFVVFDVVAYEH